jgi:hypothetical protein
MTAFAQPREELDDGLRSLAAVWQTVSEVWRDSVHDDFERRYWVEIESTSQAAIAALQRLAEEVDAARLAIGIEA